MMTIAIKIRNDDTRDTAVVKVNRVNAVTKSLFPKIEEPTKFLKGGEELIEFVYNGRSLIVEEVENG